MAIHDLAMVAGEKVSRQGTVSVVVRRSFRMGLWLGLLAGILFAVMKMVQTRREDQEWAPESAEWPPVETAPSSSPDALTPMPPLDDELPSPLVEDLEPVEEVPEPVAPPTVTKEPVVRRAAPVEKAPAEKAPAKKAAAKKATKARAKKAKAAKKARKAVPTLAWVDADDGVCPPSHPVKAKLSSRLFHLPGMAFYNRTNAERCYVDEESAVRDGFTKSKR